MNSDNQNFNHDFNKDAKKIVDSSADRANQMADSSADKANQMVSNAADKVDHMIGATKDVAANAEKSIQSGLDQIRNTVPANLSKAAHQAEDLARAGIEKARAAGQSMASQASHMRDQTTSYVREEPTKALLMAVAAGAFATLLIGWATRGNGNGHSRHH
jgi:ElaB/YqjD/DUF883 family membrane-anchored ribosome-binding protein